MNKNFGKLVLIYFLLTLGYFTLYMIDIEGVIYGEAEVEAKSKVNFVYQQF